MGDESLRTEVEALLAHEAAAEGFLWSPALEMATRELATQPASDLSGQSVAHYEITGKIGEGGALTLD